MNAKALKLFRKALLHRKKQLLTEYDSDRNSYYMLGAAVDCPMCQNYECGGKSIPQCPINGPICDMWRAFVHYYEWDACYAFVNYYLEQTGA